MAATALDLPPPTGRAEEARQRLLRMRGEAPGRKAAIAAAIRLLRPGNALLAAACTVVGMLAAGAPLRHASWAVLAPLAVLLVTAGGNALNDLVDEQLDRKAHPSRPLPSGALGRRAAKGIAIACGALAVAAAWPWTDPVLLAFVAGAIALLALYELKLKERGLAGNLAVSLLVAATFACGAATTELPASEWGAVWTLVAMALLANLAREVAKDIEDMEGDRRHRATLPHRVGAPAAGVLALTFAASAAAVNVAWLAATGSWHGPLGAVLLADTIIVGAAAMAASRPRTAQNGIKVGMAIALLPYLAAGLMARAGVGGF